MRTATSISNPILSRGEVAKILNVTPLTIANRERSGKYPEAKRDLNNYRIYTVNDVLNLQLLTYKSLDPKPIISILYDKGYKDSRELGRIMDTALSKKVGV
jgi:DNA-binding transcriptional MerR regulator